MSKNKPIKVCFVCPKAYPLFNPSICKLFGGAELDLYLLACELTKDENYEVSCIVADYGQEKIEIIDKSGDNSVVIDSVQNSISIKSNMKLNIESQMIDIKSGGMMKIEATEGEQS